MNLPIRRSLLVLGLFAWLVPLGGATSHATGNAPVIDTPPVQVIASFSILADLVAAVGGEHVEVHSLIGREQDGHVYQPRPSELRQLQAADLVVVNGLGFEGWLTRVLQASGHEGRVVVASDRIDPRRQSEDAHTAHDPVHAAESGHDHEHHSPSSDLPDPHAWQDPQHVKQYVTAIAAGLAEVDPGRADTYRQRAAAYQAQLDTLDDWIHRQFAPFASTTTPVFISPHAAMQYFGERYGVVFLAAQGVSGGDASAGRLAELIRMAESRGAAGIVVEGPDVPAVMRQLAEESGIPITGRLYSDTLSAVEGPAATYIDMMRHNTQVLASALVATDSPAAVTP